MKLILMHRTFLLLGKEKMKKVMNIPQDKKVLKYINEEYYLILEDEDVLL
jgi:hypothetical protein